MIKANTETTHEEIWAMLRELIVSQQETDRKFKDTERLLKEQSQATELLLKEQSQATDRKFQETDRKFQETDRKFQETDRKFQETDKRMRDTDRKLKEVATQIGKLGNRLGDFVEEMVRPALVRLFQERGMKVRQVSKNITAYDEQHRMQSEVDLIVHNTTEVVVVECKSQLSMDDVNEHLKRLEQFKTNFPQYTSFHVLGAVAAMVLPQNVSQYAVSNGLYLLAQSGDAIVIQNEKSFIPRQW